MRSAPVEIGAHSFAHLFPTQQLNAGARAPPHLAQGPIFCTCSNSSGCQGMSGFDGGLARLALENRMPSRVMMSATRGGAVLRSCESWRGIGKRQKVRNLYVAPPELDEGADPRDSRFGSTARVQVRFLKLPLPDLFAGVGWDVYRLAVGAKSRKDDRLDQGASTMAVAKSRSGNTLWARHLCLGEAPSPSAGERSRCWDRRGLAVSSPSRPCRPASAPGPRPFWASQPPSPRS